MGKTDNDTLTKNHMSLNEYIYIYDSNLILNIINNKKFCLGFLTFFFNFHLSKAFKTDNPQNK